MQDAQVAHNQAAVRCTSFLNIVLHRIAVQVTVACIWAALFNNLVLPWSSADWCRERLAHSYTAAAQLLADTCELQFEAYRHLAAAPQHSIHSTQLSEPVTHEQHGGVQPGNAVLVVLDGDESKLQQHHSGEQLSYEADAVSNTASAASAAVGTAGANNRALTGLQQQQQVTVGLSHRHDGPQGQQQGQQQKLAELRTSLQAKLVTPLVAVQQAVHLEVRLWHHHAPRGMAAKSVRLLLQRMLDMADRVAALQATVAALPCYAAGAGEQSAAAVFGSAGSRGVEAATAAAAVLTTESCTQPRSASGDAQELLRDQWRSAAAQCEADSAGTSTAAGGHAAAALSYLTDVLMGPLHESTAAQLALLQQAAAALKDLLLLPTSHPGDELLKPGSSGGMDPADPAAPAAAAASTEPAERLRTVLESLQQQRHSSQVLLVQLRRRLHHDIRQQQKLARQQTAADGAYSEGSYTEGTASSYTEGTATDRSSTAAYSAAGCSAGVGRGGEQQIECSMWWLHAGAEYMQQLAFQYAFDKVVVQIMSVAELVLGGKRARGHHHHHWHS